MQTKANDLLPIQMLLLRITQLTLQYAKGACTDFTYTELTQSIGDPRRKITDSIHLFF